MTKPYGLLADLHLHNWSAFSQTLPHGLNSRLEGLLNEIERAAKEVAAAGGDTLIFAGDVFHVRGSVAPSVFNPTRDRLRHIGQEHGVSVIIMPGNHDLEGRDSTRIGSAVTGLEMGGHRDGHGGVAVYNDIQPVLVSDQWAVLVPWVESVADLKEKLTALDARINSERKHKLNPAECDLIIHAPIDGVIPGIPCHGLEPDFLAGLGFKRVFAGHYHNHRQMHPGTGVLKDFGESEIRSLSEVWSIGALAHHSWSDVGSRAGFLIVHPDRVVWRASHLPQFIDLLKLEVEPEDVALVVQGNYVRVRVEAAKAKEVEAAKKELLDMGALAVLVQAEPKAPVREGVTTATVKAGASLEVQVAEFIKGSAAVVAPELADEVSKEAMDVLAAAGVEE